MSTHILKAIRVLAPNDARLIWRDGFLLSFLAVVLPLVAWWLHWLVPVAAEIVVDLVDLQPYYGLILANTLVAGEPVLLGFVIGILFVEERDEGTLLALQTSPLSLRFFMGYRIVTAMVLNVLLTVLGVVLADLVSISWPALLASAAIASLAVPTVALVYATFIKNKVQGLMLLKPVQIWGGLPTLFFFLPATWQWIASVFGPIYYPMRLFWSATEGAPEWWLVAPGVAIPGLAILWLLRRFERTVYA